MAFFHYWQEKRTLIGKWLMIIIIFLLCILQGFTLYEIFYNTQNSFTENNHTILVNKLEQLSLTKSPTSPISYLSYSASKKRVQIKKFAQNIDTVFSLPSHIDQESITIQGDYDIRDTDIWSLDSLGSLIEEIFRYQSFVPPYTLTLTDSDGKVLDYYRYGDTPLSLWTFQEELSLGFLEHHRLTAEFIYPVSYFWKQVWDKVITTLGLFILLIFCTITLFVQLRNEKRASEYRKKFTHTLVHNLRSPIIFLKQELDFIGNMPLSPEEQQRELKKCREKASNVLKNIEHLLSTSVNAYGLVAQCEAFDLSSLLNKMVELYRQDLPNKKVSITVDQQIDHPVYADPTLLEGALGNLIGNSVKFSGVDTRIHISSREEGKKMILTVTDNGMGIPAEEQKQIFRENYRGRQYMSDKEHKGFGLGLYYVMAVVIAHGGHIFVKSDGHSGSEFTIEIPRRKRKIRE